MKALTSRPKSTSASIANVEIATRRSGDIQAAIKAAAADIRTKLEDAGVRQIVDQSVEDLLEELGVGGAAAEAAVRSKLVYMFGVGQVLK